MAAVGTRQGEVFHQMRTPADIAQGRPQVDLVERGFDPDVRIDGRRIATITYTVEQPPACRKHPEGPPEG